MRKALIFSMAFIFVCLCGCGSSTTTKLSRDELSGLSVEEQIRAVSEHTINASTIAYVDSNQNTDIAVVWLKPKNMFDEDDFMRKSCVYMANTMEMLFEIPEINYVTMFFQAEMTDQNGNTNTDDVLKIIVSKKKAQAINFETFPDLVSTDYNKLLQIADEVYIDPGVMVKVENLD